MISPFRLIRTVEIDTETAPCADQDKQALLRVLREEARAAQAMADQRWEQYLALQRKLLGVA